MHIHTYICITHQICDFLFLGYWRSAHGLWRQRRPFLHHHPVHCRLPCICMYVYHHSPFVVGVNPSIYLCKCKYLPLFSFPSFRTAASCAWSLATTMTPPTSPPRPLWIALFMHIYIHIYIYTSTPQVCVFFSSGWRRRATTTTLPSSPSRPLSIALYMYICLPISIYFRSPK